MIKMSNLSEEEILEYMKMYGMCNVEQKNQIFFIVLKNHLRYLKKKSLIMYMREYPKVKELLQNIKNNGSIDKVAERMNIEAENIDISSMEGLMNLAKICTTKYENDYNKVFAFDYTLYQNDMCPLICYSFNKWIGTNDMDEQTLRKLMEFSMMSLYKVVYLEMKKKNDKLYKQQGSVADIYIEKENKGKKRKIKKVPKTMASLKFLATQEYEIFEKLKNTPLSEFLAGDYSFNEKEKIISHEFIEGETGEYYLFNHIPFKREQVESLERFYRVYRERKCKDIILDIHPGNFIWAEDEKKWILIDVGAIPEIGSDYYEFEKFEDYFDFVWKERERMMKEQPIRSMDFGIDLEMR